MYGIVIILTDLNAYTCRSEVRKHKTFNTVPATKFFISTIACNFYIFRQLFKTRNKVQKIKLLLFYFG